MPIQNDDWKEALAEHGLMPRPPKGASRLFPPPLRVLRIDRRVPLPGWRRALRAAGVAFLLSAVGLVFADAREQVAPGQAPFLVNLLVCSALLPAWIWLRSRYVSRSTRVLRGYVPGLLAVLPVLADGFRMKVWRALDDWVEERDQLPLSGRPGDAGPVCTAARRDLAFELSDLSVRPRLPAGGYLWDPAPARRSVELFCWVLADTLGLCPSRVRAMYPELADPDDATPSPARIGFVMVVVLGGQRLGVDVVCQAIREAATTVALRYDFQPLGRPASH